jgi:uncharacterized C2H2 Zn-finger protein
MFGGGGRVLRCPWGGRVLRCPWGGRVLRCPWGGRVLRYISRYTKWEEATISCYNVWAGKSFPGEGIAATVITPAIAAGAKLL